MLAVGRDSEQFSHVLTQILVSNVAPSLYLIEDLNFVVESCACAVVQTCRSEILTEFL